MFKLTILKGEQIKPLTPALARLRINLFREYPYLYDGNIKYESDYLREYAKEPYSMLHMVHYNDEIVALFSGMPLSCKSSIVLDLKNAMLENGHENIDKYYYYGEILIVPEFRHYGLFNLLFTSMDYEAKLLGFSDACLLTVEREDSHPLKSLDYVPTDALWQTRGYKRSGLIVNFDWPTIFPNGETKDIKNPMAAWNAVITIESKPNYDALIDRVTQKFLAATSMRQENTLTL